MSKTRESQLEYRGILDTEKQRRKDLRWALGLNHLSLRLMGVWPGDDELEGARGLLILLRVPFMIATMFLCLVLPQMYALALVFHELPLVIDNLLTSSAALTSCVKLFFVWRSKWVLRPVVQSVTRDWLRAKLAWERKAMIREASRARAFTISGYVVVGGVYAGFAIAPFFGFNIRMISNITDYGERHLFVQSYFPYDHTVSPNFEITQATQLLAAFFIGMAVSIPDNYFAALVFHVSAQFEILGADLRNSIKRADDARRLSCREYGRETRIYIERHVHLMRIVNAIEYSFGYALLTQIVCMSVMVCCSGFQIIGLLDATSENETSIIQILTLTATLLTLMTHILVDCFAAETLAFRSSGIFHDVYCSRWYAVDRRRSRCVIPIMAVSKNPADIAIGKMFTLSLSTYCQIVKSTAGYISMLIAVHKRSSATSASTPQI